MKKLIAGMEILLGLCILVSFAPLRAEAADAPPRAERGRYLAIIGGCNDCHTPGYLLSEGEVAEEKWLTGYNMGWRGPWGTTYAVNLRLYMQGYSEGLWVARARNLRSRPPMPWFNLRLMTDEDLRAIHRYVRSLGPAGERAPSFVPPDKEPPQPYAQFPSP